MALSRFEIPLATPATAFNILIPVTFPNAQTLTNFYIGYQTVNTAIGFKSLANVQAMQSITISQTASAIGSFGPVVAGSTVGQTVANMQIRATSPIAVTTNSGNNIGGAFSYFSEWDYFGTSTISGFSSYGTCSMLSYLYYTTNYAAYLSSGTTFAYSYKLMKGVVCHCDLDGAITGLYLTLSNGYLPSKWGITIPGYGAISQHTGNLIYLKTNWATVGTAPTATGIVFPGVGPNMKKAVGVFNIPLPVPLDQSVQMILEGNPSSTNLPFTFEATGTCAVYYNGLKTSAGCHFVAVPTKTTYTLTIL